eukprot:CAMPEP_0168364854 /NCGR_PEP_ID=MMETSP0228-20121227/4418_1 /TAXON_ID=133427 /ORGANISM="Protoceratium reticulatum, Strain CCCM 535 (=CCMP 1889)" /LENGTH=275 /DNA_ID=CAMNT_0008377619 /DNA_START=71 /DNA_END=895 /DNA_ORIENTATION=+
MEFPVRCSGPRMDTISVQDISACSTAATADPDVGSIQPSRPERSLTPPSLTSTWQKPDGLAGCEGCVRGGVVDSDSLRRRLFDDDEEVSYYSDDDSSGNEGDRLWFSMLGSSGTVRPEPAALELLVAGGLREPVSRLRGRLALWTREASALDGPLTFVQANPCGTRPFTEQEVGGRVVLVRGSIGASCLKQVLHAGTGNAAGILIADDKGDELCRVSLPIWADRLVVPTVFVSSVDGESLARRLCQEGTSMHIAAVPAAVATTTDCAVALRPTLA